MKRALILCGLLLAVTGVLTGPATAAGAAPAAVERLQALDQAILERLNAARAAKGLRPVTLSGELQNAAVAHSRAMLEGGFFAHDSKNGSSFVARVKRYYVASGYNTWSAGENLIYNTAEMDAATAVEVWLASPAHRENMLSPDWREVGIGSLYAASAPGTFGGEPTWVITMDLGARTGGATGGAKAAKSATTLALVKAKAERRQAAAKHERTAAAKARPGKTSKAAKHAKTKLSKKKPSKPQKRDVDRALPPPAGSDQADDTTDGWADSDDGEDASGDIDALFDHHGDVEDLGEQDEGSSPLEP